MPNGGARPGAGRPRGRKSKRTLEQAKVQEAFAQRVMRHADDLFNAQFSLAVGSAKVFRVDEEGEGKNKKRVHALVTDADEIKAFLDEHDGGSGEVDGSYYYITTASPDNKALDSLLNRGLGKPKDTVEHQNPDGSALLDPLKKALEKAYGDGGEDS